MKNDAKHLVRLGDLTWLFLKSKAIQKQSREISKFVSGDQNIAWLLPIGHRELLKTVLGILDFLHFDWLNGARLSAHLPDATKYGQ